MNTKLSTNRKFIRMFANILSIFVMLAIAFPATGNVFAQGPGPWFTVFPPGTVEGWDWPLDAIIHMTIEDPSTEVSPDFERNGTVVLTPWDPGNEATWLWIDFSDAHPTKPGDVITLTDGITSRTHVVQNLSITAIDPSENTVFGMAGEEQNVTLWSWEDPEGRRIETTADGTGNWGVDFDDIGFNLEPGNHVRVEVWVEGNDTAVDREVPPPPPVPFIWADPLCECINGWDWSDGDTITIEVFDQYGNPFTLQTPTQIYSADGGIFFDLSAEGIDLQPGYRITMNNGLIIKELIISTLTVKEMNPVTNTISGVYDPALRLFVHVENQEALSYDFNGDRWIATFESLDGFGEAHQPDEDGDKTGMGWDSVPTFMRYDIYTFDALSGDIQRITTLDGAGEYNPSWSPNGNKIAHDVVYWDGSHGIFITNVNTSVSHPLIGAEDGGNDAAWSPNGLLIAFDRRWVDDPNLYVVPFTGGQRRLVRADAVSASWSPNSLRMVVQDLADEGKLKTIGLLGRLEFTVADYGENPAWSPDGRWIAYQRDGDIWKVRVGLLGAPLGETIQLTSGPFWDDQPTWSGDSQNIVYHSGMTDDYDLWSVPAAGGTATWLNGAPDFGDYDPAYARHNSSVAYAGVSADGQVERIWVTAYSYDIPPGAFAPGTHPYHFEFEWASPEPGTFSGQGGEFIVSSEAPIHDGNVLLRGFRELRGVDSPDGLICEEIVEVNPEQAMRFHIGWVPGVDESIPMTYADASAHFDSITARAVWDDGIFADLMRHQMFPFTSVDWPGYVCTFTR